MQGGLKIFVVRYLSQRPNIKTVEILIWTSAIRYVSGSEMSIPSKDKARARHPKCIPGKGQKFTLTMVNLPAFFGTQRRNCNRVAHVSVYIVFLFCADRAAHV